MYLRLLGALTILVSLAATTFAQSVTINFDSLAAGTALSDQYAATTGATFRPGGNPEPSGPTTNWATNTDLTVVSATGDIGFFGPDNGFTPPSGMLLRSFENLISENGDPVFTISFLNPISDFSATFTGIDNISSTRIFAFSGNNTLIGSATATLVGTQRLSLSGLANAKKIVITPGESNDWVGVDDVTFQPVPAPPAMVSLGIGGMVGLLGVGTRRLRAEGRRKNGSDSGTPSLAASSRDRRQNREGSR